MRLTMIVTILFLALSQFALGKDLISKETVHTEKKETKKFRLENGIPVIYRKIEGNDILHVKVSFFSGTRDLDLKDKAINTLLFSTMASAAKGYPKAKVFEETENYGHLLGCTGGIESSTCELGTINDFWKKGLDLLAAVVKQPSLTEEDLKLSKEQLLAGTKDQMSDPSVYVNNTINQVFYPKGHPFAGSFEDTIKSAPKVSTTQLKEWHQKILTAPNLYITVVGSLEEKELTKALSKRFGKIGKRPYERRKVEPPKFNPKAAYAFTDRDIKSAYIRLKFNTPSVHDEKAVAGKFLTKVLHEELWEEVRTKQSLSYAVYSYTIQYSAGIGVIGVSTSKPQKTLKAIAKVIEKLKTQKFSKTELDMFKTIYTTRYFLTQEEHSSLASALASSEIWHGSTDPLYEAPLVLDRVTPNEFQKLAKEILVNFRIGVVYNKDKFKPAWAETFIKNNIAKAE